MEEKIRILVVDADEVSRETISDILTVLGYEVIEARDGDEGMAKLNDNLIKILMTDMFMPGKNGSEVIAFAKETNPEVKCVLMINWPDETDDEVIAGKALADLFMAKSQVVKLMDTQDVLDDVLKQVA